MPELLQLINQKPRNFLAIVNSINKGEDFNIQDAQGNLLFEILVDETFNSKNAEFKNVYQARLNRLLCEYRPYLNLDDIVKNVIIKGVGKAINLEQILFLIRAGASPNVNNQYNVALFLLFTHYKGFRTAEVEELVLRHGVSVDEPLYVVNQPTLNGKSCLSLFLDPDENFPHTPPNWTAIMTLIGVGANINTQNLNGDTALHLLIRKMMEPQSRLSKLRKLLSRAPDYTGFIAKLNSLGANLAIVNNKGETIFAPYFNNLPAHLEHLMLLVRLGIHPDKIMDNQGKPLLHHLLNLNGVFQKNYITELASYYADLNITDENGQTVDEVLAKSKKEIARYAMDTIRKAKEYKVTPHSSANYILNLAAKHGGDLNRARVDGNPLPHHIVLNSYTSTDSYREQLKELKRRGVDINSKNAEGQTALTMLLNKKPLQLPAIMALIALGADVNSKNKQGNTLLHLLVVKRITQRKDAAMIDPLITQLIQDYKADFTITNNRGKDVLQAIMDRPGSNTGDILPLVYLGANPNVRKSEDKCIPFLHFLNTKKFSKLNKTLVTQYNTDINIKDAKGRTLLDFEANKSPRDIKIIYRYVRLGGEFSNFSLKKLTGTNGLTSGELNLLNLKDPFAASHLLYQLLIRKKHSLVSEQFYNLIKNRQDSILEYIKTLTEEAKVQALFDSLDRNSALGKLMRTENTPHEKPSFLERFTFNTAAKSNVSRTHTIYPKKLLEILENMAFYHDGQLSNPALLMRILAHKDLPNSLKDNVVKNFSTEAMKTFKNYLLVSDYNKEEITCALNSIKTVWEFHFREPITQLLWQKENTHAVVQEPYDDEPSAPKIELFPL